MYDYNGCPIKNVFGGLNKYLAAKTSSSDPDINFKIVQDLYDSDEIGDSKYILAQRLFLSMKEISDGNICDADSFNALYNVDLALSEQTRNKLNRRILCGRIQGIYFDLVEKHIEECYPKYPSVLAKLLSIMDGEKINHIELFFHEAIEKYIDQTNLKRNLFFRFRKQVDQPVVEKLYKIIDGKSLVGEMNNKNYIQRKLLQLSKSFPDERIEAIQASSEDKCKSMYDHYVYKSCKYYREELGEKVFEPAEFDHRFLSNFDLRNPNFYRSWVYYKLCSIIDIDGEQYCRNSQINFNSG